jgi:hypothetical protein
MSYENQAEVTLPPEAESYTLRSEVRWPFRSRLDMIEKGKIINLTGNGTPVVHLAYSYNRHIDLLYKLVHAQYSYY